jgi:protoheme IX farnesyltransferase
MVLDADIDGRMGRTARRPTVTQKVPPAKAFVFASTLALLGFLDLWFFANVWSALLSLMGLLWYVGVYTLFMKRRFWNNIVIGGAAGAFPVLVGWSAVAGHLSWTAWYLFAIVFFWTPVHFWSLALLIQEDYRAVGVPMLPVVYGDRFTATQILAYAWLTSALSWVPAVLGGWNEIYFLASLALDGLLIVWSWQLYRAPERPRALRLYKYSMLYLALLFLALALGRIV